MRELVNREGSDLHLKLDAAPLYRVHGELASDPDTPKLTREDTEHALHELLHDPVKLQEFNEEHEVDFSYEIEGVARYRINAFLQRGAISLVCRAIPHKISTIDELSLPPVVRELAEEERGIVLLTGTTGSGKSTTLAAMIDHMNETLNRHIVTIEDPIEFVYRISARSSISAKWAATRRPSRGAASRSAPGPRCDSRGGDARRGDSADCAVRGRDRTLGALDDSQRGRHRVHQSHARLLPAAQHNQARSMIAGTIKGVISQRLAPSADGGRVAVCEILRMTGRVHDMILDPDRPAS